MFSKTSQHSKEASISSCKQESVEELMDFFQATKRYHLSKRFGHREYLVQSLQAVETRVQGLLSTAAAQLTSLIHKHER